MAPLRPPGCGLRSTGTLTWPTIIGVAGGASSRTANYQPFNPEDVTAYELGIKTDLFNRKEDRNRELQRLVAAARDAHQAGLIVNAGHGLTTGNVPVLHIVPHLHELNIGHTLISRAVFVGLRQAVREMLDVMRA